MATAETPEHAPAEYVTTAQLCQRLHISRRTVANHGLHRFAIKVGSQWRFNWAAVLDHYAQGGTRENRTARKGKAKTGR